jgi:hypothetical protein
MDNTTRTFEVLAKKLNLEFGGTHAANRITKL